MKRKFILQPDDVTCGPAAIYNLLVHLHFDNHKFSFRRIKASCECDNDDGTDPVCLNNTLLKMGISFNYFTKPTKETIETELKTNHVLLVQHEDPLDKSETHFVFLYKENESIHCINTIDGILDKTITKIDFISPKVWSINVSSC